jgi:four helix bundle protein
VPLRHHSLVAWQRADDLFIDLHKLTLQSFPSHERFELGSQTRRPAYSVAANIVEGCAREHQGERLQFLNTSRASLAEVGYCLHVAHRLGYIDKDDFGTLDVSVRRLAAALNGFIRSVKDGRAR